MDYKLLLTGAAMTSGAGIIYYLKGIPVKIYTYVKDKLIYTVKVYQYDELFDILETYLANFHQKQYRDVEACYGDNSFLPENGVGSRSRSTLVYKQEETTFIIKHNDKKIIINKAKEKVDKAMSTKDMYFRKYTLSGIKAKAHIDSLLRDAIEYTRKKEIKDSIRIYNNSSYGDWNSLGSIKVKPIENIILNSVTKNLIISTIDNFIDSESWYADVHIPYKKGICFHGPPGTGKTSTSLSLANSLKRNIYCLNINAVEDDTNLLRCFRDIPDNSLLLMEDVDRVFSGRDNVNDKSKITFSAFLNCLDGAFYRHGLITIITTNHLDKLDPALLRTGRIDLKVEIPKPTHLEISEYLSIFYKEPIHIQGEFDMTMSDIQEICIVNKNNKQNAINKINHARL